MASLLPPDSPAVRWFVAVAVALAAVGVLELGRAPAIALDSPIEQATGEHVTADPLPTVQHNGVVWDQTVIGDRVYAVGEFTMARPAGSPLGVNETPRSNILAYDLHTGALDTTFDPVLNAQAKTITRSPDGSRLFIGGAFTTVDGVDQFRVAALDPVTGELVTGFSAGVSYRANVLVATDSVLYVGGQFNAAKGNARANLAAFNASNGALLAWAPSADHEVSAMTLSPDGSKVIVGGRFGELNGIQARGTGALDATTGATLPWAMNTVLSTYGDDAGFLELSTDGAAIYGNAYHYGGSTVKWEGVFSADPDTGALNWVNDCHGDTYAHTTMNGYVYSVNHAHYCSNLNGYPQTENWSVHKRYSTSTTSAATGTLRPDIWGYGSFPGVASPSIVNWFPSWVIGDYTSAEMAGWTVESTDEYLLVGGEFLGLNGVTQQGLVRFAVKPIAPADQGPRVGGPDFMPQLRSFTSGQVRVSFRSNWDRDDADLTYQVIRDNGFGSPVYETTVRSTFWNRPTVGFTDTGLVPGSSHDYRVRVLDDDGNAAIGDNVSITVAGAGSSSVYADVVMTDRPSFHWRFDDSSGPASDWVGDGSGLGIVGSGVSRGHPGAIIGEPSTAYDFNGSSNARVHEPGTGRKPVIDTYTLEAWVRTTSGAGGRIIGFSEAATGNSSKADRHIYMSNNGKARFGVRQGSSRLIVSSTAAINDGDWHHLVATGSDTGLALYVDGVLVDARSDALTGDNYYGYWRVGGDNLNNWPNAPSSDDFDGRIDEVAVYEYVALSPTRVAAHYNASGRGNGNLPPTAAFTSDENFLDVDFDGSSSNDPDGTIVSYDWDFGDGASSNGVSPSHSYAAAGSYSVSLTVTDDDGAIDVETHDVTVTAANAPPTATFTATPTFLHVDFDGSGSADPDGTIVSYDWDFGDGTTGTGPEPAHTYATGGTYAVTLTVTDDDGATGGVTLDVSVSAVNLDPIAEFTVAQTFLTVELDASASSDPDGTIVAYDWDFGDGTTIGNGSNPTHTYTAPGTYTITLTVTDDDGATDHTTRDVTVDPTNQTPTASFTAVPVFLTVELDASASSDPDGTIVAYDWDFGDGTTGTGSKPTHRYATAGSYTITLTVTDDDGATDSIQHTVIATPAATDPPAPVAASETYCFPAVGAMPGDMIGANITPVNAATNGNGALHSSDDPPPATANVNFRLGSIDPNVAFAEVGADGRVCFTNSRHGPADIVIDQLVVGESTLFSLPSPTGAIRLADTRVANGGTKLAALETRCVAASGTPGDLTGVNITPVNATTNGNGALHSSDDPPPATANVNFRLGSIDPNVAFASIGNDGEICFTNSRHGPVDIVLDQMIIADGDAFEPPTPTGAVRLADTRAGLGGSRLAALETRCVRAEGADPGGWIGVNITPVNATTNGNGALHSSDDPPPATANVNFRLGSIDPNLALVEVGRDGRVCFTNSRHGPVDIVLDQLTVGSADAFGAPTTDGAIRLTDTRLARY